MTRWRTLDGRPTRIIAHRGASGLYPEHTRPAYERAVADGADVLEPDLVPSRDGILFARHDAWLSRSTDVASHTEFAARREVGMDGREDWWCDRFDAAELRTLCAVQTSPGRSRAEDGRHPLLDFDAVLEIALAAGLTAYPELKHPAWFRARGHDVAALLIAALTRRGLKGPSAPVWVQSFEADCLMGVRAALGVRVYPLVEFVSGSPRSWRRRVRSLCRDFADGVAVHKRLLERDDAGDWVESVHAEGCEVHAWTFRDDRLPEGFADPSQELAQAFALGIDAVFCDFPATGVAARNAFAARLEGGA